MSSLGVVVWADPLAYQEAVLGAGLRLPETGHLGGDYGNVREKLMK